jgi:glyoxylase-like metal-dependent hydrolase (beta-lactamase superfamily II)
MNKITRKLLPVALFTLFAMLSPAQQKESPPVRLRMISANLYEVLDGAGARGGIYIGDNAVLLIDSKMDKKSVDQTLAEVRKLTDKPVKYLVNTHSDGDHVRGNQYLPDTVIFIAQENCRKEFFHANRDGSPSEWNKPELAAYVPSITYRDRMDIYLGSKNVQLWYFGVGHTTGDTVVYFPEEKTAFYGDQVFATRPQLIHTYKGGSPLEHIKTVSRMLNTLSAEKFCSGHDEILDRAAVRAHIDKMVQMQARIDSLMKQEKDVETIKREFAQSEAALVEAFYQDLKKARDI